MPTDLELESIQAVAIAGPVRGRPGRVSTEPVGIGISGWMSLMFLVVLGSVIRIAAAFQHNPLDAQATDPGRWWFMATHLSAPPPIAAIVPFGYQLWLGILASLTNNSPTAVAFHNAVLSVLTPWIWHRVVREVTGNGDIALVGWALFCGLPSWISIFSYTMSETLLLPALGLAIWLTVKFQRTQSSRHWFGAALCWAIAAATGMFALLFALVFALWSLSTCRQKWMRMGQAIAILALFALPLSLRAHALLRIWHPFGFPEMNQIYMESGKRTMRLDISRGGGAYRWFYEFGSPALYEEPLEPLSAWRSTREGVVHFAIDEDRGLADWNRALEETKTSWHDRLHLVAENYLLFNFAPSWPDENPERFWDRAAIVTRWIWLPLAIVVMLGNLGYRDRLSSSAARLVAIVTMSAWLLTPLLPAIMEGADRKPLEGLLLVNLLLLMPLRTQVLRR